MSFLFVVVGIICNALVLFDVLTTLFSASGDAGISQRFARRFWQLMSPLLQKSTFVRTVAGPSTFITVVMSWLVVTVIGWACIYWPFLPDSFLTDFGVDEGPTSGTFLTAIYLSMVTMTTLGFGDIVPATGPLRTIVPLQGFLGMGLLTAGVSWFLSIDPVLSRRRTLAHYATVLRESPGSERALGTWGVEHREAVLGDLATRVLTVRADLAQFPITYFFRDTDERTNLARSFPYLIQIASEEQLEASDQTPGVCSSAAVLETAINDFLGMVSAKFLDKTDMPREDILERYLREHR